MAFQRFASTDPADLATLLNRLGDDLTATIGNAGDTALWGQISNKPSSFPPSSHSHAWSTITGKPSTYPPASHTHPVGDVTGLADRLDLLEYNSGERNITGSFARRTAGAVHLYRIGSTVWLDFRDLVSTDDTSTWQAWSGVIPSGFRPPRSWVYSTLASWAPDSTLGPARISAGGDVLVYNANPSKRMTGIFSWPTLNAPPAVRPGIPA